MSHTNNNVTLRLAQRADIPAVARMTNTAYAQSPLHRRMTPYQDQNPQSHYRWRLNIIRERAATPDLRTVIAQDTTSGQMLGVASWAVEGSDTPLYKAWVSESGWADWLERKLIAAEKVWCRYLTDRSVDYKFLDGFMAAFLGSEKQPRPVCIHLHSIVVDPNTRSRGVGRMLVDWGKDLSVQEGLPLFLEALPEAVKFYEKAGFLRLTKDVVVSPDGREPFRIPPFVWEEEQKEHPWLERDEMFDGPGERWKWRDDVVTK